MLHIGGLTFCPGERQLQIPNLVAAERFGKATLDRLGLRLEDVSLAFQNIVSTGDIRQALALYRQTMAVRDVGYNDFEKKKSIIETPFTTLTSPLQGGLGRIDMQVRVPSKKRILVLEWK
ncbi:hypothetical protein BGZ58_006606, partial [Dissophora ornata]